MKLPMGCLWVVMFVGMLCWSGCGATLSQTSETRKIDWEQNMATDAKTINQDIDLWLMMNRPTRLTRWRAN